MKSFRKELAVEVPARRGFLQISREVQDAVTNGRLDLGTWERIFYGEFDGQRRKRILVKVIGE